MRGHHTATLLCSALLVTGLTIPSVATGQQGAGKSQPADRVDSAIYNQEHALAKAEQQQDRQFFSSILDDGLIFVAFNGLVFTKADIVKDLNYIDVSHYDMKNLKVRRLGHDAALVTYDLQLKGSIAGHDLPPRQYASSVWVRHGGNWKLMFHQSTPANHK